jgi:hypothetical protein
VKRIVTGAAMMLAAVAAQGLSASAAHAACTATIKVANVSVTSVSPYNVKGTANSCAATASWDMDGGSGYSQTVGGWYFHGNSTDYSYFYPGASPLGAYKAAGTGAYDSNFNPLPQADSYFSIKLGSRITIRAYRSGSYVYVRAHVTRFSPSLNYGLGGWQRSIYRRVTFYDYRNGGWHADGTKYTNRWGTTVYLRIYAPSRRSFRAHVSQTATIWGHMSASVRI